MAREDMREVLLVEDDVADARAGHGLPGDRTAPDAGRPHRPSGTARGVVVRVRRRVVVPLAAVLAVVVVATAAVEDSTDRRRTAALADVPGLLQPLGPTTGERWRADASRRRTGTTGGDLIVSVRDRVLGEVVGLVDGATGRRRWVAPLPERGVTGVASCWGVGPRPRTGAVDGSAGLDDGDARVVVCRVATEMVSLGFGRRRLGVGARTLVVVLDVVSGQRLATHDLGRRFPAVEPLDGDVVLAEVAADGHARVMRVEPVTARPRWTFRSAQPVGRLTATTVPTVEVRHGVVAVSGPGAWALDPDGRLLGEWSPQRPGSLADVDPSVDLRVLPGGRFVVGEPDSGGLDGEPYGTVSTSDARDGVPVPGPLVDPVVDDGSAAHLLLVSPPGRGRVVAVDPASGRWRWQADARGDTVVLDGRLHARAGPAVTAVDVDTGRTVWRTEIGTRRSSRDLMTDGRVLLVPTSTEEGAPTLTALGLDDGRPRWTVPAPDGVEEYHVLDGHLVAITDHAAVGLG